MVKFKTILPVPPQVAGLVIVPVARVGVSGCALMTTSADAGEVHPEALVTVKLYVPVAKPEMVVVAVEPAIEPGFIVQSPAGKPLKATLPVAVEHVGWVMVPTNGADGADGSLKVALTPVAEVQPLAVICKLLYVPAVAVMVAVPLDTVTPVKLPVL